VGHVYVYGEFFHYPSTGLRPSIHYKQFPKLAYGENIFALGNEVRIPLNQGEFLAGISLIFLFAAILLCQIFPSCLRVMFGSSVSYLSED